MPPHLLRRGPSVRLDADVSDDDAAPKWIQVAYTGEFKGHYSGPFEFTRATFESFVRNLHAHPSFKAGPNGVGCEGVLAFDFSHASEQPPSSGEIPVVGTPAQAWCLDLEIRDGADGVAELWALTQYLEPARTYVREGRYKWTSVSAWFDASNPVTGEPSGPTITSIAFTNDPFLQGMVPIAATRTAAEVVESAPTKDKNMDLKALIAQRLKLKADTDETTILLTLSKQLEAGDAAGDQATEATDALTAILGALGVSTAADALAKIAQLLTDSAALAEIKPQIDALKAKAEEAEAAEVESDVELTLASYGMPASAKVALLSLRKAGKDGFAKAFPPKPQVPAAHAHLTTSPFVQAGLVSATAPAPAGAGIGGVVSLSGYVGRNLSEKALSYARTLPENQGLSYDELHQRAAELLRSRRVVA